MSVEIERKKTLADVNFPLFSINARISTFKMQLTMAKFCRTFLLPLHPKYKFLPRSCGSLSTSSISGPLSSALHTFPLAHPLAYVNIMKKQERYAMPVPLLHYPIRMGIFAVDFFPSYA